MYKKRIFYGVTLLFLLLGWCASVEAYQVNDYWTSAEGWGNQFSITKYQARGAPGVHLLLLDD